MGKGGDTSGHGGYGDDVWCMTSHDIGHGVDASCNDDGIKHDDGRTMAGKAGARLGRWQTYRHALNDEGKGSRRNALSRCVIDYAMAWVWRWMTMLSMA